jgi:adenosylcobinamide amidohydrolase
MEVLLWRFATPRVCIASAPVGGGIGERDWVLNAQVATDYARTDLDVHVAELAAAHGCRGTGVGMLTGASVARATRAEVEGVRVCATVGIRMPTWAAEDDAVAVPWHAGTINLVAELPVRLSDAALVNAVMTATEAKTQALLEHAVAGTGTATDAVCVACPVGGEVEAFGGPRSAIGARLARAVHAAVGAGLDR